MKTTDNIRIHRHAGNLAVSFDGGPTLYLSQEQAAWLQKALLEGVQDIETRGFTSSRFPSQEWPASAPAPARPDSFTVISVSANANSFGYKGLIVLNAAGDAFELHCQAYGSDPVPSRGDDVRLDDSRFACPPPRRIESPPGRRIAKIISEAKQGRGDA